MRKAFMIFHLTLYLISGSRIASATESPEVHLGPIYEIAERDWLKELSRTGPKRGEIPIGLSREGVREAIGRQSAPIDLPEVTVQKRFTVDPSVQISRPITDQTGRIISPAGSRVNPLERLPSFRPIAIIDGRVGKQVQWAKQRGFEIILATAGDIPRLTESFGRPVYPAPPILIQRYLIERVPVILSSKDKLIQVEEVVP